MIEENLHAKSIQKIWIVVKVVSGIPCYVEAYADEESAKIRTYELGQGIDLNEDDIGCYETIINSSGVNSILSKRLWQWFMQ